MSFADKLRRFTSWGCLVLFVTSLTQTAYYTQHDGDGPGINATLVLLTGWIGILEGSATAWAWLANVFLAVALVTNVLAPKITFIPGLLAVAFMLSFLAAKTVIINEAGHEAAVTRPGTGYWLWLASAAILVGANILSFMSSQKAMPRQQASDGRAASQ